MKANLKSILHTLFAVAAIGLFSITGTSQSVSLDAPQTGISLRELTRIGGTASGGVTQVRFPIGKAESDEV